MGIQSSCSPRAGISLLIARARWRFQHPPLHDVRPNLHELSTSCASREGSEVCSLLNPELFLHLVIHHLLQVLRAPRRLLSALPGLISRGGNVSAPLDGRCMMLPPSMANAPLPRRPGLCRFIHYGVELAGGCAVPGCFVFHRVGW
jgi:hypothetical protein